MFAVAASALAQSTSGFTTFDVPGAGTEVQQGILVRGIDTAGEVAATYVDSLGSYHGFLRTANDTFTIINVTDAATTARPGNQGHRDRRGGKHRRILPFPVRTVLRSAGICSRNRRHDYHLHRAERHWHDRSLGHQHGGNCHGADGWVEGGDIFERATDGTGTNFVLAPLSADGSVGIAINTAGEVAGRYKDNNNISHGFVLSANGTTITTFDPPNLATTSTSHGNSGTLPTSIDTAGDIAGTYTDANGARHGFVRTAAGVITTFDAPGADTGPCATSGMGVLICGTGGFAMDDAMDIVGAYVDRNNVSHGFLRSGSTGAITSFDAPGAGTGSYEGTVAFAINAAGTITGMYVDANSVMHGFLFTPAWTATTTTLTPAGGQSQVLHGEPASFNVTVSSSGGAPPNGEMAYLMNGATQLGSAALSAGAASITTTELPGGTDSITAIYGGDANFLGSTSAPVSQPVGKASSTTTLVSSPSPSSFESLLTLTATLEGQFGGVPTGTVTFTSGGATLGTAPVSGGNAVQLYTALPQGTDPVIAVFRTVAPLRRLRMHGLFN
jgi:hypothetical protein